MYIYIYTLFRLKASVQGDKQYYHQLHSDTNYNNNIYI